MFTERAIVMSFLLMNLFNTDIIYFTTVHVILTYLINVIVGPTYLVVCNLFLILSIIVVVYPLNFSNKFYCDVLFPVCFLA